MPGRRRRDALSNRINLLRTSWPLQRATNAATGTPRIIAKIAPGQAFADIKKCATVAGNVVAKATANTTNGDAIVPRAPPRRRGGKDGGC
jgi:hypothetical protein